METQLALQRKGMVGQGTLDPSIVATGGLLPSSGFQFPPLQNGLANHLHLTVWL